MTVPAAQANDHLLQADIVGGLQKRKPGSVMVCLAAPRSTACCAATCAAAAAAAATDSLTALVINRRSTVRCKRRKGFG